MLYVNVICPLWSIDSVGSKSLKNSATSAIPIAARDCNGNCNGNCNLINISHYSSI